MGDVRTTVCANIAYKLAEKGMRQSELADAIGVKKSAVSNWLTGRGAPDIDTLGSICKVLGTDFNFMFGAADKTETAPAPAKERELRQEEMIEAIMRLLPLVPQEQLHALYVLLPKLVVPETAESFSSDPAVQAAVEAAREARQGDRQTADAQGN